MSDHEPTPLAEDMVPFVLRIDETPATAAPTSPPLHTFIFTSDFTGQLGSLDFYRFNPMVPVIKGERYEVAMNVETGATTLTPLPPDPFAAAKAESARLYKEFRKGGKAWRSQDHSVVDSQRST